jgi:hypothetical protein
MSLPTLIANYLAYRRALGYRLTSEAFILRAFCKSVGHESVSTITAHQVRTYLFHGVVSEQTKAKRYRALSGLYRYLLIHGDPGSGKSVVMRVLAERLVRLADLSVGVIYHPRAA